MPATQRPIVVTLRPEHVAALQQAGAGGCAHCLPRTPPAAKPVRPGQYTLRFHEFRDAQAVLDVWYANLELGPARWRDVKAESTVYVFRRLNGRTTPWAVIRGGTPLTLTVHPSEAGATYYVALSRFELPPSRIREYTAAGAASFDLLSTRCVGLDLQDARVVRAAGGTTYDVVLCDYRRTADELYAQVAPPLATLDGYVDNVDRATKRVLAEVTLAAVRARAQEDAKAWTWLARPSHRLARRHPAAAGEPETGAEEMLLRYEAEELDAQAKADKAAERLYTWMAQPAYREMLYDGSRVPGPAGDAILAEGRLIGAAPRMAAGRRFVADYAKYIGTWHAHLLGFATPAELQDVKNRQPVQDALGVILGALGSARLGALDQLAQRHTGDFRLDDERKFNKDVFDYLKAAMGGVDTGARLPWADAAEHYWDLVREQAGARKTFRAASAAGHAAVRAAGARLASAEEVFRGLRAIVVEETYVRTTVMVFQKRPPVLAYAYSRQEFYTMRVKDAGPALYRPEVQAWLEPVKEEARAASREAAATMVEALAEEGVLHQRVLEFRPQALEEAGLGKLTGPFVFAFAVANAILVWQAYRKDRSVKSLTEVPGSVADVLFSTEFFVEMAGVAAREEGSLLGTLGSTVALGYVRKAGVVGAAVALGVGTVDFFSALRSHEYGQATGYATGMVGNFTVGAVVANSTLALTSGSGYLAAGTARALGWAGIALVLVGGVVVWYYKSQELRRAVEHGPWGTSPSNEPAPKQLSLLLHVLSGPALEAAEYDALPAPPGTRACRRPGVCFTIRPSLYLEDSSALEADLSLTATNTTYGDPVTGSAAGGQYTVPVPWLHSLHFAAGPLAPEVRVRARAGEVVIPGVRVAGDPRAAAPVLTVDLRGTMLPVFRLYVPLSRGLNERAPKDESWFSRYVVQPIGEAYGGHLSYSAAGSATLQLWAGTGGVTSGGSTHRGDSSVPRTLTEVRFDPFALGPSLVELAR